MAMMSPTRYAAEFEQLEKTHPCWTRSFAPEQRWAMVNDDLTAGRSVATVLISVVSLGLFAIIATLLIVL